MSSNPSGTNSNKTFTLNPKDNLSYSTVYRIRVKTLVKDLTGNSLTNEWISSSGFQTESFVDTTPPSISSIIPSDNSTSISLDTSISITFSESIDNTTVISNTSNTNCSGTIQLSSDNFSTCVQMSSNPTSSDLNKTYILIPKDNLSFSTNYKIRISSDIKDESGNNLSSQWTSTTGFTTDGIFVIVGGYGDNGIILRSNDGISWVSKDLGSITFLRGITFSNNLFVTVGDSGKILTSTDTNSWTSRNSNTLETLNKIFYHNNLFVIIGNNGKILTSDNGTNWTTRSSSTSNHLFDIIFYNNKYVVVGGEGTILTSENGTSWTSITSGTSLSLHGITYGNNNYYSVGYGGIILNSSNSTSWSSNTRGSIHLDIDYGNNLFVIVGHSCGRSSCDGKILSSSDGSSWLTRLT